MPIENRNLQPGTRLVGRYHKQPYVCEVLEGDGGKLRYRLEDGREFKSPSAAGMAITGHACDGWVFWSVEKTETAPNAGQDMVAMVMITEPSPEVTQEPVQTPDIAPEAAETGNEETNGGGVQEKAPKKHIFKTPNQKGVPDGQVRWYCHDCAKSFIASAARKPKTCPAGHQAS